MTLEDMIIHGQQMVQGGMKVETAMEYLKSFNGNKLLDPDTALEIMEKIKHGRLRNVSEAVRDWITVTSSGSFSTTDLYNGLHLTTREHKKAAVIALLRLAKEKNPIIEKTGSKVGHYRIINRTATPLNIKEANMKALDIKLPFGIESMVNIYERNTIVIAGLSNAGKSAFCLNTALMNMDYMKIQYQDSDSGEQEIKGRIEKFKSVSLEDVFKKINFIEAVPKEWSDFIDGDAFNIIDYMEDYENPYLIPKYITEVHAKLNKGIAMIALQKPAGRDFGQGGQATMNKSRLYIAIDFDVIKIIKAKNRKDRAFNPNGQAIKYTLDDGVHYNNIGGWYNSEQQPF